MSQSELTSLTHLKAWGGTETFYSVVAFLLVLPKEGVAGERAYVLTMVSVHPYQAWVSTIDDPAEQLTQLASTGHNWPYALVQFNGDACHMPFPNKGHLSGMVERRYQQCPLQKDLPIGICQLLSSDSWVGLPRRTQWMSSSIDNDST